MSILSKLSSSAAVIALCAGLLAPVAFADQKERNSPFSEKTHAERVERNRQERSQRREARRDPRGVAPQRDLRVRPAAQDRGELRGGERRHSQQRPDGSDEGLLRHRFYAQT